jgi:hypothetical protein
VDAADYVVWRKNPSGEFTEDDYDTWKETFGTDLGDGESGSVPEPSTMMGLLIAAAAGIARRSRR